MNRKELIQHIRTKKSFLCVGLDSDIKKIPTHLLGEKNPVLAFNKLIIDATREAAVSYKINTAFYEVQGSNGWQTMEETLAYIPSGLFTIADAKRGDIGNTSDMYARAFFETLDFDAVTLAPYMGRDSLDPFFKHPGKWGIVLALTSNPGSADYEQLRMAHGGKLYESVIGNTCTIGNEDNLMFVIGATKAEELSAIRKLISGHFLLVPGVGAQGGSLEEVARAGMNRECGLLVNASRSIIYASGGKDFAEKAGAEALKISAEMAGLLEKYRVI